MQKFQKGQAVLYTGPNFKGFASNVLTTIISYDKDLIFPYLINANGKKICLKYMIGLSITETQHVL